LAQAILAQEAFRQLPFKAPIETMGNPDQAAAPAAAPTAAAAAAAAPTRGQCSYGEKCTRKNPDHKAEFAHPGDADYGAAAGYSAGGAPAAPFPDDGQTEADRGFLGGLGGAAAAGGGLLAAKKFGAFDGKADPNDPDGKKHGFVQDHKVLAGLLAVGGVIAAGVAGSKAEDAIKGRMAAAGAPTRGQCPHGEKCFRKNQQHKAEYAHPGDADYAAAAGYSGGGKKKTGQKKPSKGKGKGRKTKSRDLGDGVVERGFDPNASDSDDSVSSYETGPDDEGYDPVKHSDGRPRTP